MYSEEKECTLGKKSVLWGKRVYSGEKGTLLFPICKVGKNCGGVNLQTLSTRGMYNIVGQVWTSNAPRD